MRLPSNVIWILLPVLLTGAGLAPPRSNVTQQENAALGYRAAAAEIGRALTPEEIAEVSRLVVSEDAIEALPTPQQRQLLAKAQPGLDRFHEASRIRNLDWGLDRSKGMLAEMPWLADVRTLTRLAAADAIAQATMGNGGVAVQRLIDARTLGRHVTTGGSTVISYLLRVGADAAVFRTSSRVLGHLSDKQLRALREGFNSLPSGETLDVVVAAEGEMVERWFRAHEEFPDEMGRFITENPQWRLAEARRAEWRSNRHALVDDVSSAYVAAAKAAKIPLNERSAELEGWAKRVEEAPWLVRLTLPAVDRVAEAEFRSIVEVGLLNAAIDVLIDGPQALQEHMDPATGRPFAYEPRNDGFLLRSAKEVNGEPMSFVVRRS